MKLAELFEKGVLTRDSAFRRASWPASLRVLNVTNNGSVAAYLGDGAFHTQWACSTDDFLADDWVVLFVKPDDEPDA